MLQRHAIPSGLRLCGKGFVLLQDNDPKLTSQLCKSYLKKKEKEDLVVMNFPPQSPDLNPIENLWDHLKRKKEKHQSTNKDNLWDVLNQFWNNIKPEVLKKLVHSMPNRVNSVLKAKEGHKKY